MPPEIIGLLTGDNGLLAGLLLALGWIAKQWYNEKALAKEEREGRHKDGLIAAQAMTDQRIINEAAKHQIEMRDYRLQDIQQDLADCKQELFQLRRPTGPM